MSTLDNPPRLPMPLPCPFCGSRDIVARNTGKRLGCFECHDCGATGPERNTRMEATLAWNRRPQPEEAPPTDGVVVPREVAEQAIRALRRDMNFGYEMANNWYQKGPFSSVDKGNAAQAFAKRCEEHIATLSHALSAGAK